jgi:hypothetical protein
MSPTTFIDDERNADWTKKTFDLLDFESADELREWVLEQGMTIQHFKTLPAYYLPLRSGDAPEWLQGL